MNPGTELRTSLSKHMTFSWLEEIDYDKILEEKAVSYAN